MLEEIEKSIINSNLGLNPVNNGESLLINIPPLTEERRVELTKLADMPPSIGKHTKYNIYI